MTHQDPADRIAAAEIEMRWVDAWNQLSDIGAVTCLLPDGSWVDVDTCEGFLQDSAYGGWRLAVTAADFAGRSVAVVHRWR
ncbi:hypothetical protein ACWDYH_26670 [Nocardia goodfellowii]|uniref:SnoaL-like domain-containing protein n=1 Tax=Nocardia goodfellowii TaxID=882446 RepID=A0ABS4Q9C1_9NOCA|nr:hypothetical protein [Nocardia goodfellowii]MBP2188286.1 hypothetical protein [Nocardia goodfellowii]